MRFRYTILYVENVAETLEFYEHAFGLKTAFLHEGGDYGELGTGATALAFCSLSLLRRIGKTPAAPEPHRPCFEIAFETEDVAGAMEKAVAAGATVVQEAEEMAWGQTTAYVSDMNGFLVEICTPVAT
ncbi:VOC family protein [Pseudodesulfovibrio portus]|uniref:VOC domain-containing protein n=1 Tax=Pseudodesulfovibrio portus TaxID=231439 RepID=A0ABN6RUD1_9BACT|nr:VOC family protein [Pseudodesulfovibrio portus]BDQ33473.1 hypothetical protein JCM14722_10150 [Pseudodesulfovibrio portus]